MATAQTMVNDRKEIFGWAMYDWANSAFSTTVGTVFLGPYVAGLARSAADATGAKSVSLFGIPVAPYTREVNTRDLWAMEGVTTYYEWLLLVRAGLVEPRHYFEDFGKELKAHRETPGSRVQSAEMSSFDTWIRQYRHDEKSPNVAEDYNRRGEYHFVRRKYRAAEDAYQAVVSMGEASPFYELALYKLGWSFYKQDLYDEALHQFIALLDYRLSQGYDFDASVIGSDDEGDERL